MSPAEIIAKTFRQGLGQADLEFYLQRAEACRVNLAAHGWRVVRTTDGTDNIVEEWDG